MFFSKKIRAALFTSASLGALFSGSSVLGNPTDPNVVSGDVSVSGLGSDHVIVQNNSDRAIVDWDNFSIGSGETTTINQASDNSAILNRVTGQNVTEIYGTLESNGQVYLINENGIMVGESGVVDTNGFVASTLNMSNTDFLGAGDMVFKQGIETGGGITVHGKIRSVTGGDILLLSREIEIGEKGEIDSNGGYVGLGAGEEILLKAIDSGDGRISIRAGKGKIVNRGTIAGVAAELRAAGGNEYALAINNTGVVRARGVSKKGGKVLLTGGKGTVKNTGRIKARRKVVVRSKKRIINKGRIRVRDDATKKGGEVIFEAPDIVAEAGSLIDVSGALGGGRIFLGGGYQGTKADSKGNAVDISENALSLKIEKGAELIATAEDEGNGGEIIMWSDGTTEFAGKAEAKGGANGGDGGLIEVSGKEHIKIASYDLNASATLGKAGTILFDPGTVNIIDGANETTAGDVGHVAEDTVHDESIQAILQGGSDVTITTAQGTAGAEDIIIGAGVEIVWTNGGAGNNATLTLDAGNDITAADDVVIQNHGSAGVQEGVGGIVFEADNDIVLGSQGERTGHVLIGSQYGVTRMIADADGDGAGNVTLLGGGDDGAGASAQYAGAQIGFNITEGDDNYFDTNGNPISTGDIIVSGVEITLDSRGSEADDDGESRGYTQIGHGGDFDAELTDNAYDVAAVYGSDIDVYVTEKLTMDGGDQSSDYARIGHGSLIVDQAESDNEGSNSFNIGQMSGNIQVYASIPELDNDGEFVGFGSTIEGDILINTQFDSENAGGVDKVIAAIGHGATVRMWGDGNTAQDTNNNDRDDVVIGRINGTVYVLAENDLVLGASVGCVNASDDQFWVMSTIGHGSAVEYTTTDVSVLDVDLDEPGAQSGIRWAEDITITHGDIGVDENGGTRHYDSEGVDVGGLADVTVAAGHVLVQATVDSVQNSASSDGYTIDNMVRSQIGHSPITNVETDGELVTVDNQNIVVTENHMAGAVGVVDVEHESGADEPQGIKLSSGIKVGLTKITYDHTTARIGHASAQLINGASGGAIGDDTDENDGKAFNAANIHVRQAHVLDAGILVDTIRQLDFDDAGDNAVEADNQDITLETYVKAGLSAAEDNTAVAQIGHGSDTILVSGDGAEGAHLHDSSDGGDITVVKGTVWDGRLVHDGQGGDEHNINTGGGTNINVVSSNEIIVDSDTHAALSKTIRSNAESQIGHGFKIRAYTGNGGDSSTAGTLDGGLAGGAGGDMLVYQGVDAREYGINNDSFDDYARGTRGDITVQAFELDGTDSESDGYALALTSYDKAALSPTNYNGTYSTLGHGDQVELVSGHGGDGGEVDYSGDEDVDRPQVDLHGGRGGHIDVQLGRYEGVAQGDTLSERGVYGTQVFDTDGTDGLSAEEIALRDEMIGQSYGNRADIGDDRVIVAYNYDGNGNANYQQNVAARDERLQGVSLTEGDIVADIYGTVLVEAKTKMGLSPSEWAISEAIVGHSQRMFGFAGSGGDGGKGTETGAEMTVWESEQGGERFLEYKTGWGSNRGGNGGDVRITNGDVTDRHIRNVGDGYVVIHDTDADNGESRTYTDQLDNNLTTTVGGAAIVVRVHDTDDLADPDKAQKAESLIIRSVVEEGLGGGKGDDLQASVGHHVRLYGEGGIGGAGGADSNSDFDDDADGDSVFASATDADALLRKSDSQDSENDLSDGNQDHYDETALRAGRAQRARDASGGRGGDALVINGNILGDIMVNLDRAAAIYSGDGHGKFTKVFSTIGHTTHVTATSQNGGVGGDFNKDDDNDIEMESKANHDTTHVFVDGNQDDEFDLTNVNAADADDNNDGHYGSDEREDGVAVTESDIANRRGSTFTSIADAYDQPDRAADGSAIAPANEDNIYDYDHDNDASTADITLTYDDYGSPAGKVIFHDEEADPEFILDHNGNAVRNTDANNAAFAEHANNVDRFGRVVAVYDSVPDYDDNNPYNANNDESPFFDTDGDASSLETGSTVTRRSLEVFVDMDGDGKVDFVDFDRDGRLDIVDVDRNGKHDIIDGRANYVDYETYTGKQAHNGITGLGVLDQISSTGVGIDSDRTGSGDTQYWSVERELRTTDLIAAYNGEENSDYTSLVGDYNTSNGGRGGDAYSQVGYSVGDISLSTGDTDGADAEYSADDSVWIQTKNIDGPVGSGPGDIQRASLGHAAFQWSDSNETMATYYAGRKGLVGGAVIDGSATVTLTTDQQEFQDALDEAAANWYTDNGLTEGDALTEAQAASLEAAINTAATDYLDTGKPVKGDYVIDANGAGATDDFTLVTFEGWTEDQQADWLDDGDLNNSVDADGNYGEPDAANLAEVEAQNDAYLSELQAYYADRLPPDGEAPETRPLHVSADGGVGGKFAHNAHGGRGGNAIVRQGVIRDVAGYDENGNVYNHEYDHLVGDIFLNTPNHMDGSNSADAGRITVDAELGSINHGDNHLYSVIGHDTIALATSGNSGGAGMSQQEDGPETSPTEIADGGDSGDAFVFQRQIKGELTVMTGADDVGEGDEDYSLVLHTKDATLGGSDDILVANLGHKRTAFAIAGKDKTGFSERFDVKDGTAGKGDDGQLSANGGDGGEGRILQEEILDADITVDLVDLDGNGDHTQSYLGNGILINSEVGSLGGNHDILRAQIGHTNHAWAFGGDAGAGTPEWQDGYEQRNQTANGGRGGDAIIDQYGYNNDITLDIGYNKLAPEALKIVADDGVITEGKDEQIFAVIGHGGMGYAESGSGADGGKSGAVGTPKSSVDPNRVDVDYNYGTDADTDGDTPFGRTYDGMELGTERSGGDAGDAFVRLQKKGTGRQLDNREGDGIYNDYGDNDTNGADITITLNDDYHLDENGDLVHAAGHDGVLLETILGPSKTEDSPLHFTTSQIGHHGFAHADAVNAAGGHGTTGPLSGTFSIGDGGDGGSGTATIGSIHGDVSLTNVLASDVITSIDAETGATIIDADYNDSDDVKATDVKLYVHNGTAADPKDHRGEARIGHMTVLEAEGGAGGNAAKEAGAPPTYKNTISAQGGDGGDALTHQGQLTGDIDVTAENSVHLLAVDSTVGSGAQIAATGHRTEGQSTAGDGGEGGTYAGEVSAGTATTVEVKVGTVLSETSGDGFSSTIEIALQGGTPKIRTTTTTTAAYTAADGTVVPAGTTVTWADLPADVVANYTDANSVLWSYDILPSASVYYTYEALREYQARRLNGASENDAFAGLSRFERQLVAPVRDYFENKPGEMDHFVGRLVGDTENVVDNNYRAKDGVGGTDYTVAEMVDVDAGYGHVGKNGGAKANDGEVETLTAILAATGHGGNAAVSQGGVGLDGSTDELAVSGDITLVAKSYNTGDATRGIISHANSAAVGTDMAMTQIGHQAEAHYVKAGNGSDLTGALADANGIGGDGGDAIVDQYALNGRIELETEHKIRIAADYVAPSGDDTIAYVGHHLNVGSDWDKYRETYSVQAGNGGSEKSLFDEGHEGNGGDVHIFQRGVVSGAVRYTPEGGDPVYYDSEIDLVALNDADDEVSIQIEALDPGPGSNYTETHIGHDMLIHAAKAGDAGLTAPLNPADAASEGLLEGNGGDIFVTQTDLGADINIVGRDEVHVLVQTAAAGYGAHLMIGHERTVGLEADLENNGGGKMLAGFGGDAVPEDPNNTAMATEDAIAAGIVEDGDSGRIEYRLGKITDSIDRDGDGNDIDDDRLISITSLSEDVTVEALNGGVDKAYLEIGNQQQAYGETQSVEYKALPFLQTAGDAGGVYIARDTIDGDVHMQALDIEEEGGKKVKVYAEDGSAGVAVAHVGHDTSFQTVTSVPVTARAGYAKADSQILFNRNLTEFTEKLDPIGTNPNDNDSNVTVLTEDQATIADAQNAVEDMEDVVRILEMAIEDIDRYPADDGVDENPGSFTVTAGTDGSGSYTAAPAAAGSGNYDAGELMAAYTQAKQALADAKNALEAIGDQVDDGNGGTYTYSVADAVSAVQSAAESSIDAGHDAQTIFDSGVVPNAEKQFSDHAQGGDVKYIDAGAESWGGQQAYISRDEEGNWVTAKGEWAGSPGGRSYDFASRTFEGIGTGDAGAGSLLIGNNGQGNMLDRTADLDDNHFSHVVDNIREYRPAGTANSLVNLDGHSVEDNTHLNLFAESEISFVDTGEVKGEVILLSGRFEGDLNVDFRDKSVVDRLSREDGQPDAIVADNFVWAVGEGADDGIVEVHSKSTGKYALAELGHRRQMDNETQWGGGDTNAAPEEGGTAGDAGSIVTKNFTEGDVLIRAEEVVVRAEGGGGDNEVHMLHSSNTHNTAGWSDIQSLLGNGGDITNETDVRGGVTIETERFASAVDADDRTILSDGAAHSSIQMGHQVNDINYSSADIVEAGSLGDGKGELGSNRGGDIVSSQTILGGNISEADPDGDLVTLDLDLNNDGNMGDLIVKADSTGDGDIRFGNSGGGTFGDKGVLERYEDLKPEMTGVNKDGDTLIGAATHVGKSGADATGITTADDTKDDGGEVTLSQRVGGDVNITSLEDLEFTSTGASKTDIYVGHAAYQEGASGDYNKESDGSKSGYGERVTVDQNVTGDVMVNAWASFTAHIAAPATGEWHMGHEATQKAFSADDTGNPSDYDPDDNGASAGSVNDSFLRPDVLATQNVEAGVSITSGEINFINDGEGNRMHLGHEAFHEASVDGQETNDDRMRDADGELITHPQAGNPSGYVKATSVINGDGSDITLYATGIGADALEQNGQRTPSDEAHTSHGSMQHNITTGREGDIQLKTLATGEIQTGHRSTSTMSDLTPGKEPEGFYDAVQAIGNTDGDTEQSTINYTAKQDIELINLGAGSTIAGHYITEHGKNIDTDSPVATDGDPTTSIESQDSRLLQVIYSDINFGDNGSQGSGGTGAGGAGNNLIMIAGTGRSSIGHQSPDTNKSQLEKEGALRSVTQQILSGDIIVEAGSDSDSDAPNGAIAHTAPNGNEIANGGDDILIDGSGGGVARIGHNMAAPGLSSDTKNETQVSKGDVWVRAGGDLHVLGANNDTGIGHEHYYTTEKNAFDENNATPETRASANKHRDRIWGDTYVGAGQNSAPEDSTLIADILKIDTALINSGYGGMDDRDVDGELRFFLPAQEGLTTASAVFNDSAATDLEDAADTVPDRTSNPENVFENEGGLDHEHPFEFMAEEKPYTNQFVGPANFTFYFETPPSDVPLEYLPYLNLFESGNGVRILHRGDGQGFGVGGQGVVNSGDLMDGGFIGTSSYEVDCEAAAEANAGLDNDDDNRDATGANTEECGMVEYRFSGIRPSVGINSEFSATAGGNQGYGNGFDDEVEDEASGQNDRIRTLGMVVRVPRNVVAPDRQASADQGRELVERLLQLRNQRANGRTLAPQAVGNGIGYVQRGSVAYAPPAYPDPTPSVLSADIGNTYGEYVAGGAQAEVMLKQKYPDSMALQTSYSIFEERPL